MDNLETLLEELERFEKKGGDGASKVLEEYMIHVAKTGDTLFPWHRIRYFMRFMLATVMNEFYENCGGEDVGECGNVPAFSYVPTRDKILHHFDSFSGAPFTIQRLCEIMIDPTRHYKRTDKFLRGLEKNVLVVSNIEPGRQRRSEDPQQTLVNGMQDGGLHLSPLSGSSRLSSPSHKRISSPQPTNSISNNSNDFYDSEMNTGESHVSGSEANGPNGMVLDERNMEGLSENIEPPIKKCRTNHSSHLEKASGSMDRLSHLQDKDNPYMSISEAESLEAEGSDEESNASSSSSSSAKTDEEALETGEAEATCHSENEENNKVLEDTLCGHQVGTSEASLQESDADEDTTEACSSDIPNPEESEEAKDDNNSLSSESSGSVTNQGSPDSVEDTTEHSQSHPQEEEVSRGERAGSSEATAAELDSVTETDEVSEGGEAATQSSQEEADKDSHEADSTSQAQSNHFCSQSSASSVGSSTTTVTSCTPSTASTSSASALSPVASPPSDTGGPTTSQISASASPQAATPTSATAEKSNVNNSASVDDASTTSSLSELDAGDDVASNNDSNDSLEAEETSNDDTSTTTTTKNANVSCSSSDKSDSREEPMEED